MEKVTYGSQSSMSTHTVSRDTDSVGVNLRERFEDRLGQFFRNVGVHVIAGVVGGLGSVDVETRSGAEIVCVVFALNVQATFFS